MKDSGVWQLCPKCNGNKKVFKQEFANYTTGWSISGEFTCDICYGFGIISKLTGMPPQKGEPK